jgi:hydroxymethylpyrimidine/phosphomethylpyrimidine kinase
VLLKGGHASGDEAVDHLVDVQGVRSLAARRLPGTRRGTGCQLASAVAAGLAEGWSLAQSCERARAHVRQRLEAPAE